MAQYLRKFSIFHAILITEVFGFLSYTHVDFWQLSQEADQPTKA